MFARACETTSASFVVSLQGLVRLLLHDLQAHAIPYPSAIFIREKALVVNLECVRMVVAADAVYVLWAPASHAPGTGGNLPNAVLLVAATQTTTGCLLHEILA